LPVDSSHTLRDLSVLTVTLRTPVSRDRYTQTIDYLPLVEGPARLVKAMLVLARALAALRGSDHIGTAELRTLAKMALRCIPSRRLKVVRALLQMSTDGVSTKAVGLAAELPTTSTGYILEDLHLLGAVDRWATSDADTAPFHWRLKPAIAEKLIVADYCARATDLLHKQKIVRDIRERKQEPEDGKRPSQVFACEAAEPEGDHAEHEDIDT